MDLNTLTSGSAARNKNMKMKFRGAEIELTVEELKQMIDSGMLDDEHWDKDDPWQKLIDESTKTMPKKEPFPTVALYGCNMPNSWEPFYQQDHTGLPHIDATEVTALNVTSVEKIDKEKKDDTKE